MSAKELSRLEVIQRLAEKRLRQKEAAQMLGVGVRQVKRLVRAYRRTGAAGLVSKRRGRASPNQLAGPVRHKALKLLHGKYLGFGPTLACEKLVELDGLQISDETVRQLTPALAPGASVIAEGLWRPKKAPKLAVHQMRERRACFGELVQIDGSPYAWFETRGPVCTLLVLIDDATGKLLGLLFVDRESFHHYASLVRSYFVLWGKPMAFYSDKHSVFRVSQDTRGAGEAQTQFGRAMHELDIQILCANSPQAKGRIERVNQTLQDRLVKEMRLRRLATLQQGNAYLPEFIADFNSRFAVPPRSSHDAHRPLTKVENLDHILTWQEFRQLSKNPTLQFKKIVYQIKTKPSSYALRHAQVTVCEDAQAKVLILYKSRELPFTIFHKQEGLAEIVDSKNVDSALLTPSTPHKPTPDHPWRKPFLPQKRDISTL
jgi:transposase